MSSSTRRPYLTESVHVATEDPSYPHSCLGALVSQVSPGDAVKLWVLHDPEPGYVWMKYSDDHRNGTWHYAH